MMPPVGAVVPLPVTVPVTLMVELGEMPPDMDAVVVVALRAEEMI